MTLPLVRYHLRNHQHLLRYFFDRALLASRTTFPRCFSSSSDDEEAILKLPAAFLRASDASNFDSTTMQRNDVAFDIDSGKPTPQPSEPHIPAIKRCTREGDLFKISWEDGLVSEYTAGWVKEQLNEQDFFFSDRILWEGLSEDSFRASSSLSLHFDDVLTTDGQSRALKTLYQYGILMVTDTPIDDQGTSVAALAAALGGGSVKNSTSVLSQYLEGNAVVSLPRGTDGPLRTLYGTVWSTTTEGQAEGASVADSAYGHEGLPLHTDMTYLRDPPGLQIFTMVRPAKRGGESVFGDGFAAAEKLRSMHPFSFDMLHMFKRRYRCIDQETGWYLEAHAPVISLRNAKVTAIRHNDLDRLPDLPPNDVKDIDGFYKNLAKAHALWDSILADDNMRLVIALQPGETVVVANQVRLSRFRGLCNCCVSQ